MNNNKSVNSYELARYFDSTGPLRVITVADYKQWESSDEKDQIAKFVFHRLHSRYIKPFKFSDGKFKTEFKNGFSIVANCCLLIETLQSFRMGWSDTRNRSERAFIDFFNSDKNFKEFKSNGSAFYQHVRCGILHQGETKNGWQITRSGRELLIGKKLNAVLFLKRLERSLTDYRVTLEREDWDSKSWKNLRKKMDTIIVNCTE